MQPPTIIHSPPKLDSFTKLADYQASTPATFYDSKPVLHYYGHRSYVLIAPEFLNAIPIFDDTEAAATNGVSCTKPRFAFGQNVFMVELFVTSQNLIIYYGVSGKGIEIPYPAISLHAIQRLPSPIPCSDCNSNRTQGLMMQLDVLTKPTNDDEFPDPVELILLPPPAPPVAPTGNPDDAEAQSEAVKALYAAVSACSDLHPDEAMSGDEEEEGMDDRIVFEGNVGYEGISGLPGALQGAADGGLPPPFPGSGGWITADNLDQFFDKDGNYLRSKDSEQGEEEEEQDEVSAPKRTKRD